MKMGDVDFMLHCVSIQSKSETGRHLCESGDILGFDFRRDVNRASREIPRDNAVD